MAVAVTTRVCERDTSGATVAVVVIVVVVDVSWYR